MDWSEALNIYMFFSSLGLNKFRLLYRFYGPNYLNGSQVIISKGYPELKYHVFVEYF